MLRTLSASPRRILIVRFSALGDVVRVLPMVNGLKTRFPAAEIDWLVHGRHAEIPAGHPQIERVFAADFRLRRGALAGKARAMRRRLRERRYDLVLDFHGTIDSALWSLAVGRGAVRVGWGPGYTWQTGEIRNVAWLFYHGVRYPPGLRVNRHLRHRSLVDWLGVPDLPGIPPRFAESDVAVVDAFEGSLADAPRPWVLAWPGGSASSPYRRWTLSRIEQTLRQLRARSGGTVLVGCGPADRDVAQPLAEALGAPLTPPVTLPGLACLLARCDLYVGMDTGPMHVAGLVGTPVVGIFGRSDPVRHGPAAHLPGVAIVGLETQHWRMRDRRDLGAFESIEPEAVVTAALAVLALRPSDRGMGAAPQPQGSAPGVRSA